MRGRRFAWLMVALVAIGAACWIGRDGLFGRNEPDPAQVPVGARSADLAQDLKWMWETQKLAGTPDPTHGPNPRCSTDRAINAASRVFNTVELTGKTREEVVALVGDPKESNDSIYNFPFWPAPAGALVYRFDSGAYGWQFDVVLGADGRVKEIERHWIH